MQVRERRNLWIRAFSLGALLSFLALTFSFRPVESAVPGTNARPADAKYIGVKKCRACHSNAETGDQYGVWSKMSHAKAFDALASEEAKAIAKERGIADPQKAGECLKCHTTAYGVDEKLLGRRFDGKGVQCEACHGPGEAHQKARMKAAMEGGEPKYEGVPATEIDANPPNETCAKCHNPESPTFKPFCFYEGRAKIQHLNPLKKRTDEEKAALFACPCGKDGKCPHPDGCPDGKCGPKPVKK